MKITLYKTAIKKCLWLSDHEILYVIIYNFYWTFINQYILFVDLVGENNEEAAVCDMIMDTLGVMFGKVRGNIVSRLDVKEQVSNEKEFSKQIQCVQN